MADILVQGQGQGSMEIFIKRTTVSLVVAVKGKVQFAGGGHFIQRRATCSGSLNSEAWALKKRFIERVSQHWRQQYQCYSGCANGDWDAKLIDRPSSELMKMAIGCTSKHGAFFVPFCKFMLENPMKFKYSFSPEVVGKLIRAHFKVHSHCIISTI